MMKRMLICMLSLLLLLNGCTATATGSKEIIGIIGAMEEEVALLKEMAEIRKTSTVSGMEFIEGTIGKKNVVIVQCGVGKVNAAVCAEALITRFNASCLINTGCAGSLDNRLDIHDFVVSTDVVEHDVDASGIGFPRGEIPYTGRSAYPADETLQKKALKAIREAEPDVTVYSGRICSGDQFIYLQEQRDDIFSAFGALCSEMEGAAIGHVCYLNETPYVIVRAISDKADGSEVVEFSEFEKEASERCAAVTAYMVNHWDDPVN